MTTTSSSTGKAFPGFHRLYAFSDPLGAAFRVDIDVSTRELRTYLLQKAHPTAPVVAPWYKGDPTPSNVVRASATAAVLIDEKVVSLLREINATGWGTYEVRVLGAMREPIDGFYGLSVGGRCGPIDDSKSVEVLRTPPALMRGLYFDPATWDGSDFFMVAEKGYIFVTERVKQAFENAQITNASFVSLDDYERPKAAIA